MEGDKFCTACGQMLPEGATFCPACGANIKEPGPSGTPYGTGVQRERIGFAFLILLYGLFTLMLGVMDTISALSLTEEAYMEMLQTITEMTGVDATTIMQPWYDGMPYVMAASAIFMAVSGLFAILCYFECSKMRNSKRAIMFCAISSLVVLGMCIEGTNASLAIPFCIIGLIITYLIYQKRTSFES